MAVVEEMHKLRVLLPHWTEHNSAHAAEFRDWAGQAQAAGYEDTARDICIAAEYLERANQTLEAALKKLGGPLEPHQPPRR